MKTITISLVLTLFLTTVFSASIAFAESATISVKGMVCESCAETITGKLKTSAAVDSVSVKVNKGIVEVTIKDGATLSDDILKTLIADAGYTVTEITRKS